MKKLDSRDNNLHLPWGINDFEGEEVYGFRIDSEPRKEKVPEELQKEMECDEYTIATYEEDTEEWKEANAKLGEKQQELSRHIELSLGYGEFGN